MPPQAPLLSVLPVTRPDAVPAVDASSPHEPRHIARLRSVRQDGWHLKVYGIAPHGASPREELLRAAMAVATDVLPPVDEPSQPRDGRGLGFLVVHDAPTLCYVLVHWWSERNEIHQRVFSAPAGEPSALVPHPSPAIGCVWELAVVDFERRAWLTHILAAPDGPDVRAYLAKELNTDV